MWSASQRGRAARHAFRARRSEAGGFARVHSRCALTTFVPHSLQMPLSRFFTSRRTYHGLLRIFHSCTQVSLQNVRRGQITSLRHQRQIGSPASFLSGIPHCSDVTPRARLVLTRRISAESVAGSRTIAPGSVPGSWFPVQVPGSEFRFPVPGSAEPGTRTRNLEPGTTKENMKTGHLRVAERRGYKAAQRIPSRATSSGMPWPPSNSL